jgi:hypothetical protein
MTATLTYTLGKFVWRELYTRDVAAAKRFYSGLFGWTAEDVPMGPDWSYTLLKNGDKQIGGIMDLANLPNEGQGIPPHWAVYVSVADVDATAEKAVAAGGKLLNPCMDIPNVGRFAVLQDPQGAVIQVFRSASGDPEDRAPERHEFCWENLSTTNPTKAAEFYQQVIGWGTTTMNDTILFTRQSHGETVSLASVGPAPEGTPSHWAPFVAVDRVEAAIAKARELGGEVLLDRTEIPEVGAFGVIRDPIGAAIFLFESNRA